MRIRGAVVIACALMLAAAFAAERQARAAGPAFKTVHLLNVTDQAKFLVAITDFNRELSTIGQSRVRYRVWKIDGKQAGPHQYLWESTWPDRATYDAVHKHPAWERAAQKSREMLEPVLKDHVYNQYLELAVEADSSR